MYSYMVIYLGRARWVFCCFEKTAQFFGLFCGSSLPGGASGFYHLSYLVTKNLLIAAGIHQFVLRGVDTYVVIGVHSIFLDRPPNLATLVANH